MGPKAPGGVNPPAPGPASAADGTRNPRWGWRYGPPGLGEGLGRGDPAEGCGGERRLPLARVRVGSPGGRTLAAYGTQGPRWGEPPGPRSRVRARWDPKPALGLAIRAAAAGRRGSGGAIRRGDLATGC